MTVILLGSEPRRVWLVDGRTESRQPTLGLEIGYSPSGKRVVVKSLMIDGPSLSIPISTAINIPTAMKKTGGAD